MVVLGLDVAFEVSPSDQQRISLRTTSARRALDGSSGITVLMVTLLGIGWVAPDQP